MRVIKTVQEMRSLNQWPHSSVGFVPTLGGLHSGHFSLIERSLNENPVTVVSLFLNPTQFNNPEDLKTYPHSLDEDLAALASLGVDLVFTPSPDELYPDQYRYQVVENEMSQQLCGQYRPGHFTGVLSVVMKLFQLVKPSKAYFGEKDFQQLELIKGMVEAFFLDLEIVACPIVRDTSGLALSSRNRRLSAQGLEKARLFAKALKSTSAKRELEETLKNMGIKVEYIEDQRQRRFAAVEIENVRLIDNVSI